jgi:hypothetical protein
MTADRSAAARIAVYESWARTPDRAARTSAARTGLLAKFEREARERLGPGASERAVAEAADAAKTAHYRRMSAASARKRWGTPDPPNPGQASPARKQAS